MQCLRCGGSGLDPGDGPLVDDVLVERATSRRWRIRRLAARQAILVAEDNGEERAIGWRDRLDNYELAPRSLRVVAKGDRLPPRAAATFDVAAERPPRKRRR